MILIDRKKEGAVNPFAVAESELPRDAWIPLIDRAVEHFGMTDGLLADAEALARHDTVDGLDAGTREWVKSGANPMGARSSCIGRQTCSGESDDLSRHVDRHAGAVAWCESTGVHFDEYRPHFDGLVVGPGDTVVGTLPVNLAADVCSHRARYIHLTMDIPLELRGRELSEDEMNRCGARLEPYTATREPGP